MELDGSGLEMSKRQKINLENLNTQEIQKIKSLALLNELNIFYDRNRIIVALCNKLLEQEKK